MRTLIGQADVRLLHTKWSNLDITGMYRLQLPWGYTGRVDGELYSTNTRDQRYMMQSVFRTYIAGKVGLVAGFSTYLDRFEHIGTGPDAVFTLNGQRSINVGDGALFAELFLKGAWGNVRVGGRAEQNGLSGLSTAPRFAYTGVFGPWHLKLLYSQAFRLPALQNANTALPDVGIRPERAITQELQVGRSMDTRTDLLLTAFHTSLIDPIVYVYLGDVGLQDSYVNRKASTTQGLEAQVLHTGERWRTMASFSIYEAITASSDLPEVELDDAHANSFAALPNMKGVLTASFRTRGHLWVGGNAIWQSASYGWSTIPEDESMTSEVVRYAPTMRSGVFATWRAQNTTGLSLTAGVDDIFDQGWTIASPYNNGLATLPMGGSTIRLRAEIRFGL